MQTETELTNLLAAVAKGDRAALRALYVRQSNRLFGIAMAILRDRPSAADVMQDVFVQVWEQARHFDPARRSAEQWLGALVRQTALDIARSRGRELPAEEAIAADIAIDPDVLDPLAASDEGTKLRDALARLEAKNRRGIVLAYVHGLSEPELAARLDASPGTVRSWIRRGLAGLREAFS